MGMAASQARYLSLLARQSNLEYQGQQINQERSVLSQQCTALYNSLLSMTVPTPPSTSDFTTIEYAGTDGATKFTLGNIKPSGENHLVEIQQTATGSAISANYGSSVVSHSGANLKGEFIDPVVPTATGKYTQVTDGSAYQEGDKYINENAVMGQELIDQGKSPSNYYVLGANGYEKATTFDPNKEYYTEVDKATYDAALDKTQYSHVRAVKEDKAQKFTASELSSYYVSVNGSVSQLSTSSPYVKDNGDGTYSINEIDGAQFFHQTESGSDVLTNPHAGDITIAGKKAYTFDEAAATFANDFDWEKFREAIKNTYGSQDKSLNEDDFYVFITTTETGVSTPQFALKSDVESPDGFAQTYSYTANGSYTKSEEVDQCKLQFDSQGRITKISIPTVDAETGEIIAYRDITLQAETKTDNLAYQDAYAQYEYAQYEYDKLQQEINAKTEIIQQEDRNLELKLQRLDNERTQITTELEAVDKVIQDNTESSYKTFSG